MYTINPRKFKLLALFMSISTLFASCQPSPPLAEVTATPILDGELKISARIQSTLNDYNRALATNDRDLFLSTVDQKNWVVRENLSASFDDIQRSGFAKTVKLGMTLINIEQKNKDLVLAHIRRDRDGWQADWFFRKIDDRWVISEPTEAEAGTPQMTASGNYTFVAYPIAEDVNQTIISLMPKAQEHVRKDLGQVATGKVEVMIYPRMATSPLHGGISGWDISPAQDGTDKIYIIAPDSWMFGFYDPQAGWETDVEMLLTHELARITYVRNFGNPGQGVDWFFEGLAEYVAGFDEMPDVTTAVQSDNIIPPVDTSSSARKIDLAHFANVDNLWLAYGLSESLVAFIVENYGGLDTFWKLAKSYDETQDMDKALQDTLGMDYEQFDTSWKEWLKEDYIQR